MELFFVLFFLLVLVYAYFKIESMRIAKEALRRVMSNPSLLVGLPVVTLEQVKDSGNNTIYLAYEYFSKKFVCQGSTHMELGENLLKRWPNEKILIATPDGDFLELVK